MLENFVIKTSLGEMTLSVAAEHEKLKIWSFDRYRVGRVIKSRGTRSVVNVFFPDGRLVSAHGTDRAYHKPHRLRTLKDCEMLYSSEHRRNIFVHVQFDNCYAPHYQVSVPVVVDDIYYGAYNGWSKLSGRR